MTTLLSLAMLALLITAAWCDVAARTIPNTIGVLLVATGTIARILEGPVALALSVATALLLFVLLLTAYSRGLIGGGDVKIMSALAVGLSPLDSYCFIVATTLAGGILAITYLLLSFRPPSLHKKKQKSLFGRVFAVEAWRIRRRGPLPYGVAIAAGGTFILLHTGSL